LLFLYNCFSWCFIFFLSFTFSLGTFFVENLIDALSDNRFLQINDNQFLLFNSLTRSSNKLGWSQKHFALRRRISWVARISNSVVYCKRLHFSRWFHGFNFLLIYFFNFYALIFFQRIRFWYRNYFFLDNKRWILKLT